MGGDLFVRRFFARGQNRIATERNLPILFARSEERVEILARAARN
jgi:hypothetical protein